MDRCSEQSKHERDELVCQQFYNEGRRDARENQIKEGRK